MDKQFLFTPVLLALPVLFLTACTAEESVLDEGVYKNTEYGYEFSVPEGSTEVREGRDSSGEGGHLFSNSFTAADNVWFQIDVYSKDSDRSVFDYSEEVDLEGETVWTRGPELGAGDHWFMTTVFLGDEYFYAVQSSHETNTDSFVKEHNNFIEGFKVDVY